MVEAMLSNRKKIKSYLAERESVESNKPESLARLCPETLVHLLTQPIRVRCTLVKCTVVRI